MYNTKQLGKGMIHLVVKTIQIAALLEAFGLIIILGLKTCKTNWSLVPYYFND